MFCGTWYLSGGRRIGILLPNLDFATLSNFTKSVILGGSEAGMAISVCILNLLQLSSLVTVIWPKNQIWDGACRHLEFHHKCDFGLQWALGGHCFSACQIWRKCLYWRSRCGQKYNPGWQPHAIFDLLFSILSPIMSPLAGCVFPASGAVIHSDVTALLQFYNFVGKRLLMAPLAFFVA